MIDEHLSRDLFRSIHKGWRNPGDLAAIAMAHLFELCPQCRQGFESWRSELGEGVAGSADGHDFDAALDRMRAPAAANDGDATALEAEVEAERKRATSRAEELLALSPEQRLDWLRQEKGRHSGVLLAETLVERCRIRTPSHPRQGVSLALLARIVLQHAEISSYAIELYVRALAYLANAWRVIGDLHRADQLLSDARYFLRANGCGDRLVRAELDSLEGSLRRGQDRLGDAITVLLRALMAYRLAGSEINEQISCLIKLSQVHRRRGEHDRSLEIHDELKRSGSVRQSERLLRFIKWDFAICLIDIGRPEEACREFSELRPLFQGADAPVEQLRIKWAESRALDQVGQHHAREQALLAIREGLAIREMRYDHALASMDLARFYAREGSATRAETLIDEALETFELLDLDRKAAAAVALRNSLGK